MRRALHVLCAAALLCGGAASGTGAATVATGTDIEAALKTYVAAYPHAEVIVGVVHGDDIAVYAAGGTNAATPTDRSIFQIGSITKTFTATLLAQMAQAKDVALDDPISKYLPAGLIAPTFQGKQITLRTLAEQTSGLPRLPPNFDPVNDENPYADYTLPALYAALSQTHLTRSPGSLYEYSNFGVTLLGQLLANAAHSTYSRLLETRVVQPLAMNATTVVGDAQSRTRLVPGYTIEGRPAVAWDFGNLGAAGSIESNMHDMLIYLTANLAAPAGPLGEAMATAQTPRVPSGLGGIMQIGLIWETNVRSGITWHNGETGGYHAFIGFDRHAHDGVVVLSNVADMAIDQLGVHVLAPYIPAPAPVTAAEKEPSPYAGVYRLSSAFAVTVYKTGGKLYAQGTGQHALELLQIGPHQFTANGVDAQITFHVDARGNATGLTLHQNGVDREAPRIP